MQMGDNVLYGSITSVEFPKFSYFFHANFVGFNVAVLNDTNKETFRRTSRSISQSNSDE